MLNRSFLIILYFSILNFTICFGQNKKIDSLINLVKSSKEDTNMVNMLNEVSSSYKDNGNYDSALKYANKANILAKSNNFKKGIATSYNNLGLSYYNQGNYTDALKNHFECLKIKEEIKDKNGMARSYNNIGIVYRAKGSYPQALKNYFACLKMGEEMSNNNVIATSYANIGNVYSLQENYPEALKYNRASLKIREKIGDKNGMASCYGNIGIIYYEQDNYVEALKNHFACLKIKEEIGEKNGIAFAYNNIGSVYKYKRDYSEAIKAYLSALKIEEETGDKKGIATSLVNIGWLYSELKKYKEAEIYTAKALLVATEIESLEIMKSAYQSLSIVYEAIGKHKEALSCYKSYIVERDSLLGEESTIKSLNIVHQYESEKKEKEIAQLNLDVLTKQKKVEQKNIIIYGTIAGAILVLVLVALLYNRNQLKQKNIYQTSIAKQREENALAVLQAQENERSRIAKDLHDGVGTFLSTLKLNVQTLESALSAEKKAYNNTLDLIDKTSVELRNVMNNLSDETLQQQGLIAAISELTLRVNQIGVTQIRFQHHGFEKRINTIIEINLYRAAQELVQNCLKHAVAKKATLQLIEHDASIVLMIEDNGVGFNPDDKLQNRQGGMGLNNIRKRIAFIKGSVQIESAPEKGTTWVIEVPKQFV